jgi:hypothetical protein
MPAGCTMELRGERCLAWLVDHLLTVIAFKPYEDDAIRAYVEEIGLRLAAASGEKRKWTFRVLDDGDPQAYSGFNSTIYITRGALAILRDEAELAAVIAHEMGHTISGHNREALQNTVAELEEWRELRYARDDEIQADELAVVMLGRAGYDVRAVEHMLRALGAGDEDEDASDDRHPIFRERIARAIAMAARFPDGERGRERYNERVAKLIVGVDPRVAAIVGNVVLYARSKIAVELPPDAKLFQWGEMMIFAHEAAGYGGIIRIMDSGFAKDVAKDKAKDKVKDKDGTHTEEKHFGKVTLSVMLFSNKEDKPVDVKTKAKALIAAARAPRANELARLFPKRFDPTMPRPVWSN